ncbi:MAG: hypothetical protein AB7J94_03260 [Geobacter sp.]
MEAKELTVSLPTMVQALYTVALLVFGVIGWFLKNMVARQERNIEANTKAIQDLEARTRHELEKACAETRRQIEKLRDECGGCQDQRRKEYTNTVDTYGKFGARLSRLEGEHSQQRKTGGC